MVELRCRCVRRKDRRQAWPTRRHRRLNFQLQVRQLHVVATVEGDTVLSRQKRHWVPPPKPLKENHDYTQEEYVAKIHSDYDDGKGNLAYSLEGVGANQYPFHVFVVDPKTGFIRVTKELDREEFSLYNLSGVATYKDGRQAEKNIDIRFRVVDENDNSPVFGVIPAGSVYEQSGVATPVMKIMATDADEPGNPNSQIKYSLVSQEPSDDMFYMENDGTIYVKRSNLDREAVEQYKLTVKGQDLNGAPGGNSATATVVVKLQDVNDNPPTLEKSLYEGSVVENTEGVEVMRIKAQDLDVYGTDNWRSVYKIVKGNEANYFSIKTDPNTNEGILMLDKAVDYEDVKNMDLGIAVLNWNPPFDPSDPSTTNINLSGGGGGGAGGWLKGFSSGMTSTSQGVMWKGTTYKTYPIKINVKNQREGPHFDPKVKVITMSEGGSSTFNMNSIITRYAALDGDTGKPAENVRYIEGSDPDNWFTIDPETADIRLNKMPDRESTFLVNGTYYAKVLCVSEENPSSTATGTIAIQVEDFNDHCPTLTSTVKTLCIPEDTVIVSAVDEDAFPNGAPFHFEIMPEGTKGKWQLEHLNDTAAILRAQHSLYAGQHEVELLVKDEQGVACPEPQKLTVQVCTCEDGVICGTRGGRGQPEKKSELGPAGIGLLLLGLLLLLLIPLLLLFCQCGGAAGLPGNFTEIPFDTKSHLINYRTEGQGENAEVPLMNIPTQVDVVDVLKKDAGFYADGMGFQQEFSGIRRDTTIGMRNQGRFYSEFQRESGAAYDDLGLPYHILSQYYAQKMSGGEDLAVKDALLSYDNEGEGSVAGSVGCCSLLEQDNDLQFLDDLGPKFKTLAEVCGGKKIQPEIAPAPAKVVIEPPKPAPVIPKVDNRTVTQVVQENMTMRNQGRATVIEGAENQGQMFLLQQQQPVYYTAAAPVIQPMQYVVQPQVQNTLLLAEAPATNLQGMVLAAPQGMLVQGQTVVSGAQAQAPGMVLVSGTPGSPTQGMLVQGQTLVSGGQAQNPGLVLVTGNVGSPTQSVVVQEKKVVSGKKPQGVIVGGTLPNVTLQGKSVVTGGNVLAPLSSTDNLLNAGTLSSSQTIIEGKIPAGKVVKTSKTSIKQGGGQLPGIGLPQMSNISGSQSTTVTSSGVSRVPTYRKVVVQEEKLTEL
nr:desmoglein-2.1-like [Nerophis lumbriciformis]